MADNIEERYQNKSVPDSVHEAAETGDVSRLSAYVKKGMEKGYPESVTLQGREDVMGMMPLHVACEHGQYEVVEYLVKKRVDVDAGDNFRVSPMHLAAISNHPEIVDLLIKARASIISMDVEGDTAMHWAATKGNPDVIEVLIARGASADVSNNVGWTPLHRSCYNGRLRSCQSLLKAGANMQMANRDGNTPLHLAVFMNHLSCAEALLQSAARSDIFNNRNQLPCDMCIGDGMRDVLRQYGAMLEGEARPPAPIPPTPPAPAIKEEDRSSLNQRDSPKKLTVSESFLGRAKANDGFPTMSGGSSEVRRQSRMN